MNEPSNTSDQDIGPDYGYAAILGLIVVIGAWLLLMPVIPAIARTTMNRFHLRTGTFWQWAIQQPVPAMYNLANTYEVSKVDPATGEEVTIDQGYINHFPARAITFANGRYRNLVDAGDRELLITSSYLGQHLVSRYSLTDVGDRNYEMTLQTDSGVQP